MLCREKAPDESLDKGCQVDGDSDGRDVSLALRGLGELLPVRADDIRQLETVVRFSRFSSFIKVPVCLAYQRAQVQSPASPT